jgi:predicted small lipoprotein YifL
VILIVKSPIALLPAAALALFAASALSGCGQTGPLYMPPPTAKPNALSSTPVMSTPAATPNQQAQARPAPATKAQEESSPVPAQ